MAATMNSYIDGKISKDFFQSKIDSLEIGTVFILRDICKDINIENINTLGIEFNNMVKSNVLKRVKCINDDSTDVKQYERCLKTNPYEHYENFSKS